MEVSQAQSEETPRKNIRPALYWILVLIFLAVIAHASSQTFAQQDIRPEIAKYETLVKIVRGLPEISFYYDDVKPVDNRTDPVDFIHFFIRKGAHVSIYGFLGLTLLAALGSTGLKGRKRWLYAALLILIVAAIDETHQTIMGGRTGLATDVLIDFSGFLIFSLLNSRPWHPQLHRQDFVGREKPAGNIHENREED